MIDNDDSTKFSEEEIVVNKEEKIDANEPIVLSDSTIKEEGEEASQSESQQINNETILSASQFNNSEVDAKDESINIQETATPELNVNNSTVDKTEFEIVASHNDIEQIAKDSNPENDETSMEKTEIVGVTETVNEKTDSETQTVTDKQPNLAEPEDIFEPKTCQDVIEHLKKLSESYSPVTKQILDFLKQAFYKIHKATLASARAEFIAQGGNPELFIPEPNSLEEDFKAMLNTVKAKRAEWQAKQDEKKEENLQKKYSILQRIKELCISPDVANTSYKEFKELQIAWKEAVPVQTDKMSELWRNYQLCVEQYYDQLKLNSEFREYDFKKNLETKTRLCEQAESLANESDIIVAFRQLQILHQDFKECGPVANNLREEIWNRFKTASTVINKRHQKFFEEQKAKEEKNLMAKTVLCEKIEAIDIDSLKTGSSWDEKTKQIIDLQQEWRSIGFAPQKMNIKIFERFRTGCDKFFSAKADFFKQLKALQNDNLAKKTELCERAEALKESTDWKKTTDELTRLQKEWRTIGAVPKKYSQTIWNRFIKACDYFFEQKNKAFSSKKEEETINLNKKREIIQQLNSLLEKADEDAREQLKQLMQQWESIGYVPYKEKDKINKIYHETIDKLFQSLNISVAQQRLDKYKADLINSAKEGTKQLTDERERLLRTYETKRAEIRTYENNLGFLNCKKGSSLLAEVTKKIGHLKEELNFINAKIEALDNQIQESEK